MKRTTQEGFPREEGERNGEGSCERTVVYGIKKEELERSVVEGLEYAFWNPKKTFADVCFTFSRTDDHNDASVDDDEEDDEDDEDDDDEDGDDGDDNNGGDDEEEGYGNYKDNHDVADEGKGGNGKYSSHVGNSHIRRNPPHVSLSSQKSNSDLNLYAHRVILSMRSSYFRRLLRERASSPCIPNRMGVMLELTMEPPKSVFVHILEFIYCGTWKEKGKEKGRGEREEKRRKKKLSGNGVNSKKSSNAKTNTTKTNTKQSYDRAMKEIEHMAEVVAYAYEYELYTLSTKVRVELMNKLVKQSGTNWFFSLAFRVLFIADTHGSRGQELANDCINVLAHSSSCNANEEHGHRQAYPSSNDNSYSSNDNSNSSNENSNNSSHNGTENLLPDDEAFFAALCSPLHRCSGSLTARIILRRYPRDLALKMAVKSSRADIVREVLRLLTSKSEPSSMIISPPTSLFSTSPSSVPFSSSAASTSSSSTVTLSSGLQEDEGQEEEQQLDTETQHQDQFVQVSDSRVASAKVSSATTTTLSDELEILVLNALQYALNRAKETSVYREMHEVIQELISAGNLHRMGQIEDEIANGEPLMSIAASLGNSRHVRVLIDSGFEINVRNPHTQRSPLHTASFVGATGVIQVLMSMPQTVVNLQDNSGLTALHAASANGHAEVVRLLLKSNDIDSTDAQRNGKGNSEQDNQRTLEKEGGEEEEEEVKQVEHTQNHNEIENFNEVSPEKTNQRQRANVLIPDYCGRTAIHCAVERGHTQVLKVLLTAIRDPKMREKSIQAPDWQFGFTPLHLAVLKTEVDVVDLLLNRKSLVDATEEGRTVDHDVVSSGANVSDTDRNFASALCAIRDFQGRTPLHIASAVARFAELHTTAPAMRNGTNGGPLANEYLEASSLVIELLLEAGADAATTDFEGRTCLHYICGAEMYVGEHTELGSLLGTSQAVEVRKSLKVQQVSQSHRDHQVPVRRAAANVSLLLASGGASVMNLVDTAHGNTALIEAVQHDMPEISALLIRGGADLNCVRDMNQVEKLPLILGRKRWPDNIVVEGLLQPLVVPPSWVPDDWFHQCHLCKGHFSISLRRHHCRHCCMVICGNCSRGKTELEKFGYHNPVRVCDLCFEFLAWKPARVL